MAKPPDRAMLSRLVVAYDRIAEESLGMGTPISMRSRGNSSMPSTTPAIVP
jgi:hypothetical protein